MRFNAAMPAVVAGIFLVAACGGGTDSSGNGSTTTTSNSGGGGSSTGSGAPSCPQTTIAGGDLFVDQQGPVGVTLQSPGGLSQYTFTFLYDNVFGISTNNPQDKWGSTTLFGPGTSAGASTQVQLQPYTGFIHGEQTPSTFPKGIPVELWLTKNDGNQPGPANSSSTASIGKDLNGHDAWHTASVTYAANSTATVTFFPSDMATFSVTLTNVKGAGSPTGPGC
jgi:hypothetical protein